MTSTSNWVFAGYTLGVAATISEPGIKQYLPHYVEFIVWGLLMVAYVVSGKRKESN